MDGIGLASGPVKRRPRPRRVSSQRRPNTRDEILTIREVATYLRLDEKSIYRMAWDGQIPGFKVRNAWRFRSRDLDAWIESQVRGRASAPHQGRAR